MEVLMQKQHTESNKHFRKCTLQLNVSLCLFINNDLENCTCMPIAYINQAGECCLAHIICIALCITDEINLAEINVKLKESTQCRGCK